MKHFCGEAQHKNKAPLRQKLSICGNRRVTAIAGLTASVLFLAAVTAAGMKLTGRAAETNFAYQNLQPCRAFLFGTDWLGRDMLARTLAGLSMSIRVGLLTAAASAVIALILGTAAALLGRRTEQALNWLIDLMMGIPHMLFLILISFACGRGFAGAAAGIIFTHWMSLARVVRGEVLALKNSAYVQIAEKLGESKLQIAGRHILPHLLPQFLVGLILLFPHAILHEAGITFLGFGLPPEQPAIGIILSEGARYLTTGKWWLALLPGGMLVFTVMVFDYAGRGLAGLLDVHRVHE